MVLLLSDMGTFFTILSLDLRYFNLRNFVDYWQEYDLWYRKPWNDSGSPVLVLDENELYGQFYGDESGYFHLGSFVPTDSGK